MKKKRVGKAKRGCCGLGLIIILNKVDREGLTEKVPFEGKDERRGGNHVTQQGGGQSTSGRGPSKHPEMDCTRNRKEARLILSLLPQGCTLAH